jgi:hypothetical protein
VGIAARGATSSVLAVVQGALEAGAHFFIGRRGQDDGLPGDGLLSDGLLSDGLLSDGLGDHRGSNSVGKPAPIVAALCSGA